MTEQEKIYFEALKKDRADSDRVLQKTSMRGVKTSVVEKYSDQAHFIYELLQNADDAGATEANFELYSNKLIFKHNGTRLFSVSNPDTEDIDTVNGNLGDINAITSIANSNKTAAEIGKFGVGFKSVFQYTKTPKIYDPHFRFYIDNFIVPIEIENDLAERKPNETAFEFPFNHEEKSKEDAYSDIATKLSNLKLPILFLTNLKFVYYHLPDKAEHFGIYGKSTELSTENNDTKIELIKLTHNVEEDLQDKRLWLFTRKYNDLKYSIGFFVDETGKLTPVKERAFCFFPTKEETKLNFIIHAPFLLTDSREGIKATAPHNKNMISLLSELAADSLVLLRDIGIERKTRLIDDNIIDIIPFNENEFNPINDGEKISFIPFFTAIKKKFETEELLPAEDGYVSKINAYWAAVTRLTEVFGNEQLALLCHNPQAKWVFTSLGRENTQRKNEDSPISSYIDDITKMWLDESALLKGRSTGNIFSGIRKIFAGVDSKFIKNQSIDWLHNFYKWIAERNQRIETIKQLPIFLDKNGNAVAAYHSDGSLNLFFDVEDNNIYTTVNAELMKNEETVAFLQKLGIKTPALKDEIYSIILPQYEDGEDIETLPHFKKIFDYYKSCPQSELTDFIEKIREVEFVLYSSKADGTTYRGKAQNLYFPNRELLEYFETAPDTKFVKIDEYKQIVKDSDEKHLYDFLKLLGVKSEIELKTECPINYFDVQKYGLPQPTRSTSALRYTQTYLDGFDEILSEIIKNKNLYKSICLWNALLRICKINGNSLSCLERGKCSYFYYFSKTEWFTSTIKTQLLISKWLFNPNNEFVSPLEINVDELRNYYEADTIEAKALIEFLSVNEKSLQTEPEEELTEEQRRQLELDNILKEYNVNSPQELAEILRKLTKKTDKEPANTPDDEDDGGEKTTTPAIEKVIKKIRKKIATPSTSDLPNEEDTDEDDYTKPAVDYNKKIEQAEEKSRIEIERIAHLQELQTTAANAEKYSYLWFKTLLEMERLADGEDNGNSREISITFANAELEAGTTRTLILKHPNRYIPQFMEDLADIPLTLHYGNQTKKVAIEVMNVQSYSVRAKLKSGAEIEDVDLALVNEARIDAKNPTFLLEELIKGFNSLDYANDFNLKTNLTDKIDFIFGPPGTGKTTHLANNVILPLIREDKNLKVLVLTPTNKAADVITKRIMECDKAQSYSEWLIRFGISNDEAIEHSGIYKDKTFDIRTLSKNVTVTTIARFPYDFFMPDGARLHLSELKWDYIIIDEASMIPLANIIFPLYKKTPTKFIIAGDPFQIQPITRSAAWKDENIYTMVELNSFTKPTTVPHAYKIELLTTQYRSVPTIGKVYSDFAYGGVLKHNRLEDSKRKLNIDEFVNLSSLNIVKFPISKYESIYKPKRLQGKTPYQIYSALFTFELVKFVADKLAVKNKGETFSIGIIAPYRAQADLIDKLFASFKCPAGIDIQVGTIHGFQGDECDIVFAVFNPPPKISSSKDMFLNKKNIINVSISRARDYLIIIMPDDNTENIEDLRLIKRVEDICNDNGSLEYLSPKIEELIFNDSRYLENNSFATSHQIVNVYGKPELKYEIRSEETAVDIQIHTDEND
ncbi:MAG: AAA family ATPase [Clostridia bacterium]|nr:AAA family ATPase [Clostridia bacterium]